MMDTEMPAWIEPQLATLTRDRFSDPAWIFERKLDGERCLAYCGGQVRLMSRNQHQITGTFPEIADALTALHLPALVLDGEIVAFDRDQTSFARLQRRLGVAHPASELLAEVPVFYYIFDVMYSGGRDTRGLPQGERKQILRGLLSYHDPLRYTEHRDEDGEAYWHQACRSGWEGVIAKRNDAPYRGGRSKAWLKFKCENSQEFVIGGYTDPRGSRVGFGALLLGYYEPDGMLAYAGKVGTGFDQAMLRRLHAELARLEQPGPAFAPGHLSSRGVHWVQPRLVAQVAFSEWTQDDQLRHPRFQGLRSDKDPAEVVREVPA